MIAAVAQKTAWSWSKFAFNWFDVAVVVIILFGLWRGRKNGMSREFLPVLQWISIVTASGFGYSYIADWLMHGDLVKSVFGKNFVDRTPVLVSSYLLIALLVFVVFVWLRRRYGPKLVGSSAFGSGEYYLGMISGVLRFLCMMLAALALLNAPIYTQADILATKNFNQRWFGGGLYSGDYLPDLQTVQAGVFRDSLLGPVIRDNMNFVLINSVGPAKGHSAAGR